MAYTAFDRFVAWCRYRAVLPHVRRGSRLCDIGCGLDAGFLTYASGVIECWVGLDRQVFSHRALRWPLVRANITQGLPLRSECFEHVVMLAVLEHLREPEPVLREAYRVLLPGGSLILTWPHEVIDPFLHALHRIGLVSDEMESQEHRKRIPLERLTAMLEQIGFREMGHERFELGLNNLLVAFRPR